MIDWCGIFRGLLIVYGLFQTYHSVNQFDHEQLSNAVAETNVQPRHIIKIHSRVNTGDDVTCRLTVYVPFHG